MTIPVPKPTRPASTLRATILTKPNIRSSAASAAEAPTKSMLTSLRATGETMPEDVSPAADRDSESRVRPLRVVPDTQNSEPTGDSDYQSGSEFAVLRIWAEMFEDAQKARIACGNRAARGSDPTIFGAQLEQLQATEHQIGLAMRRAFRTIAPPGVVEWQKETIGIGEHLLARLVGTIGHPVVATPYHWEGEGETRTLIQDPPFLRTVSQLWSYCGHGDATRKRRKGMTAEEGAALGNPRAKMLVHLLAEACMKQRRSPYRVIYDDTKAHYKEGRDWSDGHCHNAALRKVGKEVLKDLWIRSQPKGPA